MPGIGLVHHHLLHTEAGVQGSDGPLQFSRQLARNEFPVHSPKVSATLALMVSLKAILRTCRADEMIQNNWEHVLGMFWSHEVSHSLNLVFWIVLV